MGGGGGGGGGGSDGGDGIEVKKVTVNIRFSSGKKFAVEVSLESSVESFKSVVAENCDIPAEEQRLIYKGRILIDDQTLKSYGLEAEHTVHLIRGFVPAASNNNSAGTATTRATNITPSVARGVGSIEEGTMGGDCVSLFSTPGGMSGARIPGLEQLQRLRQEISDNLMNNPFHNLNPRNLDPAFLQRLEAARDSELRREARRNIGSSPETVNMLMRMFENVHEPFLNAATMGAQGRYEHDQLNNPMTAGPETTTGSLAPNTNPLPNPWAAGGGGGAGTNQTNATATHPPPVGLGGVGIPGLEGLVGSTTEPAMSQLMQNPAISRLMQGLLSNPNMNQQMMALQQSPYSQLGRQQSTGDVDQTDGGTVPPEERFATQLAQLQEMGFFDTRENLQALAATAGNVQAAVERLLGNPPGQ